MSSLFTNWYSVRGFSSREALFCCARVISDIENQSY